MVVLYGFLLGFIIPYLSRRFAKFMPATLGYALYRSFKPVKVSKKTNKTKKLLWKRYRNRSFLFGLITAVLFGLALFKFGSHFLVFKLIFIYILLLLAEIDNRMFLLPDILTYPLLLIGLCFALFTGGFINITESVMAASLGYLLPVFASLFLVWKNPEAFGGGDIKLLSAIGAWLGVSGLLFVIISASIGFGAYSLIRRQRSGAFGPAIAIAAIVVAMLFF